MNAPRKKLHRLVVEIDKDLCCQWRGYLMSTFGQTVSTYTRDHIIKTLEAAGKTVK